MKKFTGAFHPAILPGTMPEPLVYVLIINWNGREHLADCFDSLLAGTYRHCRFVLIDNNSDDDSIAFIAQNYDDPRVEILALPENMGWSGGNNRGIERSLGAGADYVFLLNNDTATAPDAIERLVAVAESKPECGALAPKMVLFDTPYLLNSVGIECSIIGSSWDIGVGRIDGPKWAAPRKVLGVCGGAMFIRSKALREAGLLPDFQIYLDDLDLCLRIWNAGYTIWNCPEAVVRHKFSATMGEGKRLRQKYYLNTRNRMRLVLRNFPSSKMHWILPKMVLGEAKSIGRGILDGEYWKLWAHTKAWGASLAYLPEARRARKQFGASARFWDQIRHDRLFFPGVELPENGWYPERMVNGERLRPISKTATMDWEGGELRITLVNCYPSMGVAEVEVFAGGQVIQQLVTTDRLQKSVTAPEGEIEFRAKRIFDADETGELCDFGGWLRIGKHVKSRDSRTEA
ncbi:MAG: glycosyltransferase family 2 protein [Candidatus Hydrogenedentota bacterium]